MPIPLPYFPPTATTDQVSDHSYFNASLGLSSYDQDGPDVGARVSFAGEYLAPKGYGGYAALALGYVDGDGDSESAIGNLEVGGVYAIPSGETTSVVLRGGLVLPTGPGNDDFGGFIANYGTILPRLTDLAMIVPETTFFRGSVSPLYQKGQFFFRGDLGLDVAIDEPDDIDQDPVVRANLALGFHSGPVTVAGELVTLGTTGDVDAEEDRFIHTAAVSFAYDAGSVRPFGAVVVPVDNELSDFLGTDFAVVGGLEVPFGKR